ncbi:MAG TPA: hypothetical protein VKQ11_00155 [Candidatus Sulfotelmatobacter sp.]|nr:hypothetical protein [Candidatus Sulfotelmatobacter sp.]
MAKSDKRDFIDWDAGREGYLQNGSTARVYAPHAQKSSLTQSAQQRVRSIRREERFGSLIAAAGMIWGVYMATHDYASLWIFDISRPGPLEVCALGILAWLHAKWRRSLKSG